eukprot:TRINITY_DN17705_c2_g1_i1.p1 TRINITY_DN17705_c2_g1~~TRINITY_DN17705_c2_g1_i1.p1  ORF type:complete len:1009 (+),score=407.76 TRINITY_DN17705_c2_g1_i1:341-3028(+)
MGVEFGVIDPSFLSNKGLQVSKLQAFITNDPPVVASNLDVTSYFFAYFIDRYHISTAGGIKIGYIPIWGDINKVQTINFETSIPPISAILRSQNVSVIIGLCLFTQEFYTDELYQMSNYSKYGLDALLLPDDNKKYTVETKVNGTWMLPKKIKILPADTLQQYTQIDMEKDGNNQWVFTTTMIDYSTSGVNDAAYQADTAWYDEQVRLQMANNYKVGAINASLIMTEYACMEGECEPGNLIADAIIDNYPSGDFVILNGGGIFYNDRTVGWPHKGPNPTDIMVQNVTDLFPFANSICDFQANATGIWTMLEHGVAYMKSDGNVDPTANFKGAFFQTANIQVVYDPSRDPGHRITTINIYNKVSGVWEPISRRRKYKVISTSYLCQDGGDGYPFTGIDGTLSMNPENVHALTTAYLTSHEPYTPMYTGRTKQDLHSSLPAINLVRLLPTDCTKYERYLAEWEDCEQCPEGQHHPVPGTDPCVNLPSSSKVNLWLVVGIPVGVAVIAGLLAYWLVTNKQRKINNLFNANRIATDCAAAVAGMKLEELDYLFTLEKPTSIQQSFITIVTTLKSYRDYMPQSVLESHDTDKDCETDEASSILFHANGGVARVRHDGETSSVATSNTHKSEKFLLATGLKKKHVTVMVVNIVGFRKILQAKSHTEVEQIHSSYIKKVLSIIGDKGVAEPFYGDRVVVSWNSSRNWAAHKEAGCKAGLALTRGANKFEYGLEVCVGISSSSVLAGNIGVDGMRKFSLLGPCYNESFVLMMLNQKYKTTVLVGASIASSFTEKWFLLFQDRLFNGKAQQPLELWELIGEKQQDEQEWMYSLASSESKDPHRDLNEAWRFFLRDEIPNARSQLNKVELKGHSTDLLRSLIDTAHERNQGEEYFGNSPLLLDHL